MLKLIKFLKNYKAESIIAPLFKFLEAIFELIVPIVMAKIIDVGIKNLDTQYIWKMSLIMVGLGVLGFTCSIIAQYFSAKAAHGYGTELRNAVYKKINTLSYSQLDSVGISTLITRMTSDINQSEKGVNRFLRLFLRSPFIVLGAVIASFILSVKLGLIVLGATLILAVITFVIMKITIPKNKLVQEELDNVMLLSRENLSGARVIRAFSKQKEEEQEFRKTTSALSKKQIAVGRISGLLSPLTYVFVNLGIVAILWFGGGFVNGGTDGLTQGAISALINYMTQILVALTALSALIITLAQASASSHRINELLNVTSDLTEGSDNFDKIDTEKAIEFEKVSFAYEGGKNVLSDISFSINKGETIGIIGGTGSGKSTLINLIPRFYDVTEGSIKVNGIDVKEYSFKTLRGMIGLVPQKATLFKGTVRENIKVGNKNATDEEILKALEIAQAKEFILAKEGQLDGTVEAGGKNFSGGQRQRLTIARAVVKNSEIIIFDDSSSALDYATESALRKSLKSIESTKIIISQRASSVKTADKIIVLDDGKIDAIGTHEELLKTSNVYKEICLSQLSKGEVNK